MNHPSNNDKIAVLVSCHNRKHKTIAFLESFYRQQNQKFLYSIFLCDDGSTDGTTKEVRALFPQVNIIQGDGGFWWTKSQNAAWRKAVESKHTAYLWFNDDAILYSDALQEMENAYEQTHKQGIVVGSFQDPHSKKPTHLGRIVSTGISWRFLPKEPTGQLERCDTFNGAAVLIPHIAYLKLGMLDETFKQRCSDFDYGLRAKKIGIPIYASRKYIGALAADSNKMNYHHSSLNLKTRIQKVLLPTGLPPKEWFVFCLRHGGILAVWRFLAPYIKILFGAQNG